MDHISAGEAGGILAGVLSLLVALGGGLRWLLGWGDGRVQLREAKLASWETGLVAREIEYRQRIEARLIQAEQSAASADQRAGGAEQRAAAAEQRGLALQRKFNGLRRVTVEVVVELERIEPDSVVIARAKTFIPLAFPPDFDMPESMAELLIQLGDME